jgi:hypothetical protein
MANVHSFNERFSKFCQTSQRMEVLLIQPDLQSFRKGLYTQLVARVFLLHSTANKFDVKLNVIAMQTYTSSTLR